MSISFQQEDGTPLSASNVPPGTVDILRIVTKENLVLEIPFSQSVNLAITGASSKASGCFCVVTENASVYIPYKNIAAMFVFKPGMQAPEFKPLKKDLN